LTGLVDNIEVFVSGIVDTVVIPVGERFTVIVNAVVISIGVRFLTKPSPFNDGNLDAFAASPVFISNVVNFIQFATDPVKTIKPFGEENRSKPSPVNPFAVGAGGKSPAGAPPS
jgi:hypothetical protein